MKMKQIVSTLIAGLLSAVLLAGCTVFVNGEAVNSMDLVDEEGVVLNSVSDWIPGESRTFRLDALPEDCKVNVVSSDRALMTADYADKTITLTAVESGHAIITIELSMEGSSLSKSYEVQITARHMQAGMTLPADPAGNRPGTGLPPGAGESGECHLCRRPSGIAGQKPGYHPVHRP